jgi:hypothetical protein
MTLGGTKPGGLFPVPALGDPLGTMSIRGITPSELSNVAIKKGLK